MSYLIVILVSIAAFGISSVSGGGAGLLLIPLVGHFVIAEQVPVAITIGTATSSISRICLFFNNIQWYMVGWIVSFSLLGIALGAWLLSYLDTSFIELALSMFLMSNLLMIFKKQTADEVTTDFPVYFLSIVGFLIGAISSLVGAVGVLFNRIYFKYGLSNEQVIATRAANEIVSHLIKLAVYAYLGILSLQAMKIGALVAMSAIIATFVVKLFINRIPKMVFVKIGYSAMVISGLFMLSQASRDINEDHHPRFVRIDDSNGKHLLFSWDNKDYGLHLLSDNGIEFKREVSLTSFSQLQQAKLQQECYKYSTVVVNEVYDFKHELEYEVHCMYLTNGHSLHKTSRMNSFI
ncbi:MAG: sulfite exporter TauE/SafE family protein [Parashewanella sp.]